ncbi:hypothetical protein QFZ55_000065 [Streptomyces luteogriseus]|nr:hypothetical protein [Streptomyces luteogriseus]
MAGVDQPVQQRLGDDGVGEEGIPVAGRPVAGGDQGSALSLADELVEVVGLWCGQLAHREVVEDEQVRADEFTDALVPSAVRVAAGELGEDAAGLGEADACALADGEVAEGLGDVCLSDTDRAEKDDGLAGVEPAQGGQVADLGGGQLREGVEVEPFQGGLLLELRFAQAAFEGDGLAAGDLVLAEDLEEVEVSEFAALGLGRRASRVSSIPDSLRVLSDSRTITSSRTRSRPSRSRPGPLPCAAEPSEAGRLRGHSWNSLLFNCRRGPSGCAGATTGRRPWNGS